MNRQEENQMTMKKNGIKVKNRINKWQRDESGELILPLDGDEANILCVSKDKTGMGWSWELLTGYVGGRETCEYVPILISLDRPERFHRTAAGAKRAALAGLRRFAGR